MSAPRCRACTAELRQRDAGDICAGCLRSGERGLISRDLLATHEMRRAIADVDLGEILVAVRDDRNISQDVLAELLDLSQGSISKLENHTKRGLQDPATVVNVLVKLGIPPELLGFARPSTGTVGGEDEEAVWMQLSRRGLGAVLAAAAFAAAAPDLDRLLAVLGSGAEDVPRRIGEKDVEAVETMTATLRTMDYRSGGGLARQAAVAQLRSVLALRSVTAGEQTRLRLLLAAADLASITAWIAYDCERHDEARRWWLVALKLAGDAKTHPRATDLRVGLLLDMAHQGLHLDDSAHALYLVQLASTLAASGEHPVCDSTRSYLHTNLGWVRASQGDADSVRRAMGDAVAIFDGADNSSAPPWAAHVTDAEIAAQLGHAWWLMAEHDPAYAEPAAKNLQLAVDSYGPNYARSRAVNLPGLAGSRLLLGDIAGGVSAGHDAVKTITTNMNSRRAYQRLRPLRDAALKVGQRGDVVELVTSIDRALAA